MAAIAQPLPDVSKGGWRWFRNYLAQELAPFPGRGWIVARMVIAATLMMLWIMTFRIPGAALGAYYTLLFARDSPEATLRSALTSILAVGCSLVFVLLGVAVLTGDPFLHFVWVAGTLFVTFFLISTLSEYRAGTAFGFLAVTSIGAWDFPGNTELLLEGTLWTALAVATAAGVTVAVEFVSQGIHPSDQLIDRLDDRLRNVVSLLRALASKNEADEPTRQKLAQYAMTGTASLRRLLARSNQSSQYVAEMSAVVALVGRLVDISASAVGDTQIRADEEGRFTPAADRLDHLRQLLKQSDRPGLAALDSPDPNTSSNPLLLEVERTITRIRQVFAGAFSLSDLLPSAVDFGQRYRLFKEGAFSDPAHIRFALKGTLAAIACYLLYNAIEWRGLSTSIATCMITALSNVGSSRQKQLLRVSGALLGGVGFGMASQVFVLPHIDGIFGFTLLFVAVTGISSWIATASPRLSYAGAQTAFAFYVTQLRGFGPQISLAVARDDVMGILLGLLAMWLLFDRIWAKGAVSEMMESFVANIRRLASFDKQFVQDDRRTGVNRSRAARAAISNSFDQIRNEADAVIFEFGAGWEAKVALRNQVRTWQPLLRTYFLLQVALLQYRLLSPNRLLESVTEVNVKQSEDLLRLMASSQDRLHPDAASAASGQLGERVARAREQLNKTRTESAKGQSSPLGISRSMLDVVVSLATHMAEAR